MFQIMTDNTRENEFRGMYCNVDGLNKAKLDEISDVSVRDPHLLFIFAAEVKHQKGMRTIDFDIKGFTCTESLREDSQTGGLVLWSRDHTGKAILPWEGLKTSPPWMGSERSWVLVNDQRARVACCGLYLRVESPKNSDLYKSNVELLEHLEKEKAHLESLGYSIGILGDFNARIEPGPNFQFNNYPHEANNNGKLVTEFAKRNQLYCLNGMEWKGKKEEKYTYQRDMGHHLHQSIIDYALASTTAIQFTTSFTIQV